MKGNDHRKRETLPIVGSYSSIKLRKKRSLNDWKWSSSTYWFWINCMVNALLPTPPAVHRRKKKEIFSCCFFVDSELMHLPPTTTSLYSVIICLRFEVSLFVLFLWRLVRWKNCREQECKKNRSRKCTTTTNTRLLLPGRMKEKETIYFDVTAGSYLPTKRYYQRSDSFKDCCTSKRLADDLIMGEWTRDRWH